MLHLDNLPCSNRLESLMTSHPTPAIVLVDDEPTVLTILQRSLQHLADQYDLIPVSDGATALAQVAQRPVALLITDHRMPGMDGVTLIAALKATVPGCPVVLISGYLTPALMQQGLAAGVDFYVPKPFGCSQIAAVAERALGYTATVVEDSSPAA
jgi:CheY-like chemotaxis protein